MNIETILLLVTAGGLGGAINAVAGGATLFTFPALIFAGLPPVIANASSSMALTPGHLLAVISERDRLPPRGAEFVISIIIAAAGGMVGAYLLFVTSERAFTQIVPILIGFATLIFAFGKSLQGYIGRHGYGGHDSPLLRLLILIPVSVYGGYFGAGMGVVLMAVFSITSQWPVRTANVVKNLLGACANWAALSIFISSGMIRWPETLAMLCGAIIGGYSGARLLKFLHASTIRITVVTAGTVMTLAYIWKYWL
jgi:uncharacterized protein